MTDQAKKAPEAFDRQGRLLALAENLGEWFATNGHHGPYAYSLYPCDRINASGFEWTWQDEVDYLSRERK